MIGLPYLLHSLVFSTLPTATLHLPHWRLKGDTLKRETMEESARKRRASSVPAPQNKRKLSLVLGER